LQVITSQLLNIKTFLLIVFIYFHFQVVKSNEKGPKVMSLTSKTVQM